MARPSRHLEALDALRVHYRKHGILPTVEVLATQMGYRSTSSAFKALQHLITDGYVDREERGGRLLPGRLFNDDATGTRVPKSWPELGDHTIEGFLSPKGVDVRIVAVTTDALATRGIAKGDFVVVARATAPSAGDALVVVRRGRRNVVLPASEVTLRDMKRAVGTVIAQFRRY